MRLYLHKEESIYVGVMFCVHYILFIVPQISFIGFGLRVPSFRHMKMEQLADRRFFFGPLVPS